MSGWHHSSSFDVAYIDLLVINKKHTNRYKKIIYYFIVHILWDPTVNSNGGNVHLQLYKIVADIYFLIHTQISNACIQ